MCTYKYCKLFEWVTVTQIYGFYVPVQDCVSSKQISFIHVLMVYVLFYRDLRTSPFLSLRTSPPPLSSPESGGASPCPGPQRSGHGNKLPRVWESSERDFIVASVGISPTVLINIW